MIPLEKRILFMDDIAPPPPDVRDLVDLKFALSQVTEIPDMAEYAQAWADLAAEFEKAGYMYNGQDCLSRAKHYGEIAVERNGEYRRVIDLPFATLELLDHENEIPAS